MHSEVDITKHREEIESRLIDDVCNNAVDNLSSANSKKINYHNDEQFIYREFSPGKIDSKSLISFFYNTFSGWEKFCYFAAIFVVAALALLIVKVTHIIVFPTLVRVDSWLLTTAGILLACVYIGKIIFESVFDHIIKRALIKIESSVQYATMQRALSLTSDSLAKFYDEDLGQIVFIAGNCCKKFVGAILKIIPLCIITILLLVQMNFYAPYLFVPTLVITIFFLLLAILYMRAHQRHSNDETICEMHTTSLAYSIIRGIRKIRLYNAERRAFSWWADSFNQKIKSGNNTPMFVKYYKDIIRIIELIGLGVIYFFAAKNNINSGSFYIYLLVYSIIVLSTNSLSDNLLQLGIAESNYKSLESFRCANTEDYSNKEKVDKLTGKIQLANVKFKYGENLPLILDDVNLNIEPGQFVAIVGKTGCGKTTLARLLLGFEKPTAGTIFYDQKDLSALDIRYVRSNIGVVSQYGKLINGSIEDNILISNPTLTHDDVVRAAKIADIADDIDKMPMGYQTIISDETGVISGGQRQRVLIARAVVNNPNILVFDEATSSLHNNTQLNVTEALTQFPATKIVIAHRLSTIINADKILLLDDGKIVEEGTFDELIATHGKFFELVEQQRL